MLRHKTRKSSTTVSRTDGLPRLTFAKAIAISDIAIAKVKQIRIASGQLLDACEALFARVVQGVQHHHLVVTALEQLETRVASDVSRPSGDEDGAQRSARRRRRRRERLHRGSTERQE